jgi:ribosomal protein S18 acetylase RimI-like enzyme
MANTLEITVYRPEYEAELLSLWRASFEFGVGRPVPNSLDEHREYLRVQLLPESTLHVALQDGELVGFVASTPVSVLQLYVHVDHLGRGIGSRLLDLAKARSDGKLWLYTFATNTRAQRFYRHHGFDVEERGFEPIMQLEDLRYSWKRSRVVPPPG